VAVFVFPPGWRTEQSSRDSRRSNPNHETKAARLKGGRYEGKITNAFTPTCRSRCYAVADDPTSIVILNPAVFAG